MTETAIHPLPTVLRRLSTLRELPADELQRLSDGLRIHEAPKGTVILALGAEDDCTLYLLDGSCRLVAADGGVKRVRHTDSSALAPLARLRPSRYQVVAESPVSYLRIDNDLVEQTVGSIDHNSSMMLETYQVEEEEDLGHMAAENRLTLKIYEDLNTDHLLLPSLPRVAVRIGEAVNRDDANARTVASLIETDPAIALKIVKAANSARYGGISRIATVTDAVARLGMYNTRLLVVTFTLRELFRTTSKPLEIRMLDLWEHSRRIAAVASVLGEKVGGFNVHEALLAGLVHDIGALAVIGYARDFPEVAGDPAALEASIHSLRSQLSAMILSHWQMQEELVTAAREAESWYRQHPGRADYADLVIAAQLHEGIAGDVDPAKVPALRLLGLRTPAGGVGIELLHDAQEEVALARALLGG